MRAEQVSLCEVLDRVLNKGAVVAGELTVSVADVDLLYLGLQVVLASVETARGRALDGRPLDSKDREGKDQKCSRPPTDESI